VPPELELLDVPPPLLPLVLELLLSLPPLLPLLLLKPGGAACEHALATQNEAPSAPKLADEVHETRRRFIANPPKGPSQFEVADARGSGRRILALDGGTFNAVRISRRSNGDRIPPG
jgi:hypothetical protein